MSTITKSTSIAVSPQAHSAGRPLELDMHRKMFRIQPDFPLTSRVKLVSGTNPWRAKGLGWWFYEKVLRHHPEATVGELLEYGRQQNIAYAESMEHLRWLFTWGGSYIEIDGQLYSPPPIGSEVVTRPKKRGAKAVAKAG